MNWYSECCILPVDFKRHIYGINHPSKSSFELLVTMFDEWFAKSSLSQWQPFEFCNYMQGIQSEPPIIWVHILNELGRNWYLGQNINSKKKIIVYITWMVSKRPQSCYATWFNSKNYLIYHNNYFCHFLC